MREHKEECRKAAAMYRGNDDESQPKDYSNAATADSIHNDIKCAKIFQTTQEELDILQLMREAQAFEREQ